MNKALSSLSRIDDTIENTRFEYVGAYGTTLLPSQGRQRPCIKEKNQDLSVTYDNSTRYYETRRVGFSPNFCIRWPMTDVFLI